jgi:glucose/arabinose dehydrogenase
MTSQFFLSRGKILLAFSIFGLAGVLILFLGERGEVAADVPPPPPLTKAPPTEFECRWATGKITIDGKADEEAWKNAQVIDTFYLPWLGKKARPARTATKAKLLWDREYLYFFADMEDSDLYADVKEHDGMTWNNDVFELFFKPAEDKPGYYEFQVNAAGTIMDMFLPRRGAGGYQRFKSDGKFHIEAKVVLRGTLNNWTDKDQGWSVEGKIPWKDFLRTGGRPAVNERWKFALCRYDYSVDFEGPELSTCAPLKTPPADFHRFEEYAGLRFLGPPKKNALKPFAIDKRVALTTSKVVGSPDPPPPYRIKKVYADLKINYPIAVIHQPGSDRLIFCTQTLPYASTAIWRMKDDPKGPPVLEKLLDQDACTYSFVFHPNFQNNGYIYLGLNGPSSGSAAKKSKVVRYTMNPRPPYTFDPKSEKVIIEWQSDGHNGAALAFGHDGMLYVTSGDGTSDSDTKIVGQDMSSLLAKVLRIDVDHPDPGKSYSVPKDNPFVHMKGARPEIWAYGVRNPWRMTVDRKTGHLWVAQNGQDLLEQAYLVKKGENYGWSVMEGSHPFYPKRKPGPTPFVKPTVEHHHSEARSLTGGIVYYGSKLPGLRGAYIYGDYSTGKIWGVKHDGQRIFWHKELADTRLQITGFGTDSKGEILICDHRGQDKGGFYTLETTPKDQPASTFPRKLSDSGLFRSVKGHVMEPALIPYSVNAPLWGDKAFKQRWIGLPGADTTIEFPGSRGWNFPDQTVIVKSFGLEMEEGNPASRRWIETRFLTNQKGEWFGYSYAWNDEQTEGFLVDGKGMDMPYTIKTADGTRKQVWHYPSRTECMVCHSRAANWVLGLTELQMNKVHNYGTVSDNQLRTLEHLGVFKIDWAGEVRAAMREELKAKGKTEKEIDAFMDKQTRTRNQRDPVPTSMLAFAPEKYRKLVDPYDAKADLALRARSYLHSNCAQCHVEAGGGNAQIDLEFTTSVDKMKILDVKPQHHTFNLPRARLISPGHSERSVLLYRMSHRKEGHMPPLATSMVDHEAVEMLREWIRQMAKKKENGKEDS